MTLEQIKLMNVKMYEPIKLTDFEMFEEMVFGKKNIQQTPTNLCECGSKIKQIGNEHICLSCGLHYGYEYATEYIDYYKNRHKIRGRGFYNRKYHIEKMLRRYRLPNIRMYEFIEYFRKIEDAYRNCTFYKKKMISFNYLFKKVFEMMGLKQQIEMCKKEKHKHTLKKYDGVWDIICVFNGWKKS